LQRGPGLIAPVASLLNPALIHGRPEGTKKYVFNAFEQQEKEACRLFAAKY